MRRPLTILALLIASLAVAAPAAAATLEVTSEAETGPGSLGETILEAGPGDTIEVPAGEYLLTNGDVLVDQGNTIRGAGTDQTTIVPSGGGGAVSASNVVDATIAPPLKDEDGDDSSIETKAQIVALVATLAIFLLVLDLVRRRRLAERYALLWMLAGVALLALAIWTSGLDLLADLMGIQEPANAIFILAFGVISVLLLHFSVAITRLSEETKILAQESARLEHELRVERGQTPPPGAVSAAAAAADKEEDQPPVGPQPGE
jgi:hypothetical protein